MTLVAGSYEKYLWGFSLKTQSQTLKPLFSFPAHLGPIKSVAAAGPVAASGSSDDTIKIYDLSTKSEIGSLIHHTGAITSLSFFTPPPLSFPCNLVSSSDDGTVGIYDTDPFVHLMSIRAHKRGVADCTVHPSGKLAFSVGRDSCLSMLNLIRGRRSFCCRLDKEASLVRFCIEGDSFFMATEEKLTVHNSEDAKMVCEIDCQRRILCAAPSKNNAILTGGEDRSITAWDLKTGKAAYCIKDAHSIRVKGLVVLGRQNDEMDSEASYLVASSSSDGIIRVWDVRMVGKEVVDPYAEASTRSRLICLAGSPLK